jgi:aspartyl-tRNA(Asn)/glutamyl-tRNA(Gln) amidotransferase subunit B
VLAANPELVAKFRGGKTGVLGALVGQVMRETRGRANPKLVNELLVRAIQS